MSQSSEENQLIAQRRRKLAEWRDSGPAFPNDFRRDALAGELRQTYGEQSAETLEVEDHRVSVGGRMVSKRVMGKASFVNIEDVSGRIQLFLRRDDLGEECYGRFKSWDVGDIVGAVGSLFKTRTGELSVKVDELRLLVKTLRPLPEKFHGLADQEQRYRQRYLDLLMNAETRRVMRTRTAIVTAIRAFFDQRGFLEVETPMMHSIPGGAAARPFSTHHNALDAELYLRIAPELYLKRLVVGGFEKVYELNRNFRNEGVSTRHNPEFTMLEYYQAYATYEDAMDLTEALVGTLARQILEKESLVYQGQHYDLSGPYRRLTLKEAIISYNDGVCAKDLQEIDRTRALANRLEASILPDWGIGKILLQIFEKTVEHQLGEPTFITGYPTEVSPLARCCDTDPEVTDRFEFFIAGREIANGFSELNDYEEQAERFRHQVAQKEAGDDEAMVFDADYIRALEYGLPPTAGEGIGIDRLVMLFTDSASIRDVLLFPHLRREAV